MPIQTLNIKVDQKLDQFLSVIQHATGNDDKAEIMKNLIVNDAIPNIFSDPRQSAEFLRGLISFLKDKAYDTPSKYYISLALENELQPFKQIVEIYAKTFPKKKELLESMTDEILVLSILDLCEYMYSKHIAEHMAQSKYETIH